MRTAIVAIAAVAAFGAGPAFAQGQAAPAISEAHARSVIMDSGCGSPSLSVLSMDTQGNWYGLCSGTYYKVDTAGKVSKGAYTSSHVTEAQARSLIMDNGCSAPSLSTLSMDTKGNWMGMCSGTNYMVDQTGKVTKGSGAMAPKGMITEAHARSIIMDNGCGSPSLSTLSMDTQGNWVGMCSGATYRVDQTGKVSKK